MAKTFFMMKINHLSQLQTSMVDSYGTQIGTSSRGGFARIARKRNRNILKVLYFLDKLLQTRITPDM